jgi:hypothetical protein
MALYVTNTVGNLCTQALKKLQVVDDPNSVPAEDMDHAAQELQLMLKSWVMEGATIWMRRESSAIDTVAGTANIDLSTNSLTSSEVVGVSIAENGDSVRTKLKPISRADYFALSDRTTEGKPVYFWPQFTSTDQDITLWPTPDAVYDIYIDYRLDFTSQDERTDVIEVPDYMLDAIVWNLAARMLPEYGKSGKPEGQHIIAQAKDLKDTAMTYDTIQDGGGVVTFVPDWR